MTIYTDNGATIGNRTRYFRDCAGGVEWIYAVDHAGGCNRWYGFGMAPDNSISKMMQTGHYSLTAITAEKGKDMAYTISTNEGIHKPRPMATVETMDAARDWLNDFASKCRTPGEVGFEVDPDGFDAADAVIITGRNIKLFTIEAA